MTFHPDETEYSNLPKMNQTNLGCSMAVGAWNSSVTSICWMCTWGLTGLSPVRPLVVFTKDGNVGAGKVVKLLKE